MDVTISPSRTTVAKRKSSDANRSGPRGCCGNYSVVDGPSVGDRDRGDAEHAVWARREPLLGQGLYRRSGSGKGPRLRPRLQCGHAISSRRAIRFPSRSIRDSLVFVGIVGANSQIKVFNSQGQTINAYPVPPGDSPITMAFDSDILYRARGRIGDASATAVINGFTNDLSYQYAAVLPYASSASIFSADDLHVPGGR